MTAIDQGRHADGDVVSGGYDGHVICWDHEITKPRWAVRFADLVNAVRIDDHQRHVAVAVADGFVYILNATTGFTEHRLGPHADDVNDVAWDPNQPSKLAVVCDAGDTNVYVWDTSAPDVPPAVIGSHQHGVFAIAYSPSEGLLASASEDCTVRIWDVAGGAELASLTHPGDVETLAWSSDGQMLATGCDDGQVRLWERSAGSWVIKAELADATASIRCVRISPTGRYLVAGSYDGTLRLHDIHSGEVVQSWTGIWQWERACLLPDDESVIVGSFGDRPARYQIGSARGVETLDESFATNAEPALVRPTWGVNALAAGVSSQAIVATDCGVVTELDNETPLLVIDTLVACVAVNPRTGDVAVTDYLGRIHVIGPDGPYQLAATEGGPLNAVAWVDDNLVTGGYDGVLRMWGLDGRQLAAVVAHRAPVKSVIWSHYSRCVVTGSSDDTVASWRIDAHGFTMAARLAEPELVLVNAVAAPLTRPWVAVASRDRRVRLWVPDGSRPSSALPIVHEKSVKAIDVHHSGNLIVSGSYDGTLCFWRLDDDDTLLGWRQERLHGKPGVSKVCVGPDSVYSAGWDGTVAQWSLDALLLAHFVPAATEQRTLTLSKIGSP